MSLTMVTDTANRIEPTEVVKGIGYGLWYSKHHLIHSYLVVPFGLIILFTILYGLNVLLADIFKIKFPASVLGMLINLVVLCILNILSTMSPNHSEQNFKSRVSKWSSFLLTNYLMITKPSMNFTLKWINVFFIPSFIILPLSDSITFIECLKIAGVFVVGGLILLCIDVYMILGLKWVLNYFNVYKDELFKKNDDTNSRDEQEEMELRSMNSPTPTNPDMDQIGTKQNVFTSMRDDITTIDIQSLRSTKTEPVQNNSRIRSLSISDNPFNTNQSPISSSSSVSSNSKNEPSPFENLSDNTKKITVFITKYIDWILFITLFIVSLPLYYIKSIHTFLPYHLSITIISYYLALLIPIKWPKSRKFAHPILVLTAEILFVCFIGSLIYHSGKPKGFLDDLKYYKTGKTYINLFSGKALLDNSQEVNHNVVDHTATPQWPGCGDFLSSLMDISIVSLSLPMFTHRKDFTNNFWVLMPPILVSIALTFFCYPIFCYTIGIESLRSIGFIGRLVTLALGTPLINALGGSVSLMAVCTILSGICGVLIGDSIFNFLRVPTNDYVTRGVTLGINCGAIATAHLLNIDPRAASMSSLSFSIFGTVMVIMASIGAIRLLIQSWVGM
ncbi:hypothetical protein HYPBUDRAFT_158000 [Hyphopichia burtonii NRRL Y-1933]|uniref:LrgB-domain-containing protein n=1 Tax=Hyphopichia burtonii NRRL Y-1933 TaxID=984485 RepID=A0A1E4RFD1_9ASCO|nr:hypothetical protein HYPBUDRAFT_158000 [Hyphopichia burtonii NRRL Y-1933]ODV65953.1 hypothetical protein HYPBUDRAFT_158000 [Hyphopichia burtonii NRRL Y-1933]